MKVYPFASFLVACAHTSGQSGCPLHAYVLKPHPLLTIFHLSFLTLGGTGPGVHDERRPPESRDGGEERSLPATKRVCAEDHISALEVASAHGESTTHLYTGHLPQQHQHHKELAYQPLKSFYHPSTHPHHYPPYQIWNHSPYQPTIQPSSPPTFPPSYSPLTSLSPPSGTT